MNEEKKGIGQGDFSEMDFQPTQEERRQARLEHLLANVERGWKVSIIRVDPSWARGHLETKEIIDAHDQIDIQYLIDNWGGHRLQIKVHGDEGKIIGGGTVSLYSYPPRVHGEILKRNQHQVPTQTELQAQPPAYYQQPAPNPTPQLDIRAILDLVGKQKGTDVAGLLKVLEFAQARQQPINQMGSMADQMLGMLGLFREMQSVFGSLAGSGGGAEESDSITPVIAEVVKSLVQKQNAPAPARGALVSPRRHLPTSPQPASVPEPSISPETDPRIPPTLDKFANDLSSLDAEEAAGVVLMALDKMPPGKARAAMTEVLSAVSGDDDLDDSLNLGDTDRQGYDEAGLYTTDHED